MTNPWDAMNRAWSEIIDQQTALTQEWLRVPSDSTPGITADTPSTNALFDPTGMGELWKSWTDLGGSLMRNLPTAGVGNGIATQTLGRMTDPLTMSLAGGGQVGDLIRRMTEGPRFADIGATEHRVAKLMQLWLSVQTSARHYESVVAGAWLKTNQEFAKQVTSADNAEAARGGRQALRLWLEIANQTLMETHRSTDFLTAQRDLLRHGMDFLLAERAFVEELVEPAGLPTRSEIDEVHHSVLELKRRVRVLEKQNAALAAQNSAEPTGAARKTRPRSPRQIPATEGDTA